MRVLYLSLLVVLLTQYPRQKYFFQSVADPKTFLTWGQGEMRTVKWGVNKNSGVVNRSMDIPAAYYRVVCQLTAEIAHASNHSGHEALRRCSYAMEVLDAFGAELSLIRSANADFRSKVLTPILQRHLRGVPDHYTPVVSLAFTSDEEAVTISDATNFYLKEDPTDPQWIPSYRRNLISIPEVRWHLSVVLGKAKLGDGTHYDKIRKQHDTLMKILSEQSTDDEDSDIVASFSTEEVALIVEEELEDYFGEELADSVWMIAPFE